MATEYHGWDKKQEELFDCSVKIGGFFRGKKELGDESDERIFYRRQQDGGNFGAVKKIRVRHLPRKRPPNNTDGMHEQLVI